MLNSLPHHVFQTITGFAPLQQVKASVTDQDPSVPGFAELRLSRGFIGSGIAVCRCCCNTELDDLGTDFSPGNPAELTPKDLVGPWTGSGHCGHSFTLASATWQTPLSCYFSTNHHNITSSIPFAFESLKSDYQELYGYSFKFSEVPFSIPGWNLYKSSNHDIFPLSSRTI